MTIGLLTMNDAHLLTLKQADWEAMKYTCALAQMWGTGRDLFLDGVRTGPVVKDIHREMALNHHLDALIEVQGETHYSKNTATQVQSSSRSLQGIWQ
jgi:hypothetical protein